MTDESKSAPPRPRESLKVLVVEDSPVNLQLALMQLQNLGHSGDSATNGREALERLAERQYDVILMDCQMPEMDGFEATWQIRHKESEQSKQAGAVKPVQIIAMTADAAEDSREKCLAAGMNDYVSKPVQVAELEAALERATRSPEEARLDAILDPMVLAGLRLLRQAGRPDPVAHLIALFLEEAPGRLTAIEQALKAKDMWSMSKIVAASTSLKGSASNVGARDLASLSGRMEEAARDGALEDVGLLLDQAREELERVSRALKEVV